MLKLIDINKLVVKQFYCLVVVRDYCTERIVWQYFMGSFQEYTSFSNNVKIRQTIMYAAEKWNYALLD